MNNVGKDLNLAATHLLAGGVVAFPTETVMGMGVVYDNITAYDRLNYLKGKRGDKPYSLMIGKVSDIEKYAYVDERAQKLIDKFLPGPLTLLLNVKENVPGYVTHDTGVIGIRVSAHPIVSELINKVNKPLLVPSANPSNQEPATTVDKVLIYFSDALDYIIDNDSNGETPSTIVDLTKKDAKILREGKILREEILNSLGE